MVVFGGHALGKDFLSDSGGKILKLALADARKWYFIVGEDKKKPGRVAQWKERPRCGRLRVRVLSRPGFYY
jgi:hypothetical protein